MEFETISNNFVALISCSNDLAFSVEGYTLVTLNNMFTAANGVYIKVAY